MLEERGFNIEEPLVQIKQPLSDEALKRKIQGMERDHTQTLNALFGISSEATGTETTSKVENQEEKEYRKSLIEKLDDFVLFLTTLTYGADYQYEGVEESVKKFVSKYRSDQRRFPRKYREHIL